MNTKPGWTTRLSQTWQRTEVEKQAAALIRSIEELGAHELLTQAQTLVGDAMCTLGKWHDDGEPGKVNQ